MLLADTFGRAVDYGYANLAVLGRLDAVLVAFFYILQLYFDFSGYCDMARGISRIMGIEIPANFNAPYQAVNIVDFWKRWHITLSRFFTKYVYIPLGGSRRGQARTYMNLMLVFLLSGLWHGAGWHYLVWGATQGVLYVLTKIWQNHRSKRSALRGETQTEAGRSGKTGLKHRIMTLVSRVLLIFYVAASEVYFRAESVAQANRLLLTAVKGPLQKISVDLAECFRLDEFWYVLKVLRLDRMEYSRYLLMWLMLAAGIYLTMIGKDAARRMEEAKLRAGSAVVFALLAVWCVLSFSQVSTFLYYNF